MQSPSHFSDCRESQWNSFREVSCQPAPRGGQPHISRRYLRCPLCPHDWRIEQSPVPVAYSGESACRTEVPRHSKTPPESPSVGVQAGFEGARDGIRGKRNRREVPRIDGISASVSVEWRNRTLRAKTDWVIEEDLWELNPDSSPESLARGKWGLRDFRFGDLGMAGEAVQAGSSGSLIPRRRWLHLQGRVDLEFCLGRRRLGRRALTGSSRPAGLRILIRGRLSVLRGATRPCLETPSCLFSFAHQRSCAEELHVHCTPFPFESRRCCGATSPS